MTDAPSYWLARFIFQRGLALVCLIAFLCALFQFRALCGERGLLPIQNYLKAVPYRESPSLFYLWHRDSVLAAAAWAGVLLSLFALAGFSERYGTWLSMVVWAALWVLYMSFVNTGQIFYGFGWESILLEGCFLAIFLGANRTTPQHLSLWLVRWLLFRVMFGAGLIKLRGDRCWHDLTCLDWHYETQPIPNPFSWYLHWGPQWTHKAGVLFNHFAELIIPFGYFLPQPFASIAGVITIVFQGSIMVSGNLSWLNFLTIILAIPTIDDRFWRWLIRIGPVVTAVPAKWEVAVQIAAVVLTVILSVPVVLNMVSKRQVMNLNFNPLHLVGTYGAFGSITRPRYEVILEGTEDKVLTSATRWVEYEFKAKPGNVKRTPPQIAPYHLRIDWLMWFAAMSSYQQHSWIVVLVDKLLEADRQTLSLLANDPFNGRRPQYVRAQLYLYEYTTPAEHRETGAWWKRKLVASYLPPLSLESRELRNFIESMSY